VAGPEPEVKKNHFRPAEGPFGGALLRGDTSVKPSLLLDFSLLGRLNLLNSSENQNLTDGDALTSKSIPGVRQMSVRK